MLLVQNPVDLAQGGVQGHLLEGGVGGLHDGIIRHYLALKIVNVKASNRQEFGLL